MNDASSEALNKEANTHRLISRPQNLAIHLTFKKEKQ
jgi:hypothetical protein